MFGSFFGDAIDVIGRTFFGVTVHTPCLWFAPLDDPMRLLMFSFLLGIIHLFTGLGVKFYLLCKEKKYLDAMTRSVVNDIDIKKLLKAALTDKTNDREIFMKGIDYSYYYEEN